MAYKVIILYRLYMPSYFLGTFTEYPEICCHDQKDYSIDGFFKKYFLQILLVFGLLCYS